MMIERPFSQELWEQIPTVVQDYIRALEARVTALEAIVQRLEATVQQLTERLQQDSRTSSRPPSSDPPQAPWQTAAPRAQWASARRATRPRGADAGVGAGRGGGRGHPRQARALSALPAPLQGEDPQPQRHQVTEIPAREAGGHRVSVAPVGLPGLWRSDPGGVARGRAHGGIRPAGAGDHGAVHGGVSSVEAHHPERPGRSVWRLAGPGDDREPGAGDRPGGGRARGRGAGLCPGATGGLPGRNGVARRAAAGLAVDGGHRLGHGLCGAAVAQWQGGPGTLGGALLGVVGDGSLECLHLVSHAGGGRCVGRICCGTSKP